jgi:hypothetical protein
MTPERYCRLASHLSIAAVLLLGFIIAAAVQWWRVWA